MLPDDISTNKRTSGEGSKEHRNSVKHVRVRYLSQDIYLSLKTIFASEGEKRRLRIFIQAVFGGTLRHEPHVPPLLNGTGYIKYVTLLFSLLGMP